MMRTIIILFAFCAVSAFGQSITATKSYVDRKYAEATNAVAAIVTNEVAAGWSEWKFHCDIAEIQAALDGSQTVVYVKDPVFDGWRIDGLPEVDGYAVTEATSGYYAYGGYETVTDTYMEIGVGAYYSNNGGNFVCVKATRQRIEKNALGLARLKDIEPLPTAETVTNIVRDQIGTVWDSALGVAWEARMHNGNLYYIAVTNVQEAAK